MEFFIWENNIPTLDVKELYMHRPFAKIMSLQYNKECDGDSAGQKRHRARKLLKFFAFFYDWKSPFFGQEEKERMYNSKVASGIGADYKISKDEQEAGEYYHKLLLDNLPQINILKTLKETLRLIDKGSAIYNKKLNEAIEFLENAQLNTEQSEIDNFNNLSNSYHKNLDNLLQIGDKVSKLNKDIKTIENELKVIESDTALLKGGKEKGNRMD